MTAMSATVDTNVLLYASDEGCAFHSRAVGLLNALAGGPEPFYVFWPVVVAYAALATDPGLFERPLSDEQVTANVGGLLARANVRGVGDEEVLWNGFAEASRAVFLHGDFVSQGYLVAMMRQYGVRTLWSRDPSYRRFEGIVVRDPFGES